MSSSAGQRELLKLTRLAHNRLCADCKVSLGEQRILASLRFQVFICEACSEQHISILGQSAQIRAATGDGSVIWSKEDVAKMLAAGNNVAVNNTLERFVPQDWKKLSPFSSTEERRKWISAKYDVLYFSFPDGLNYTAQQQLQHQQQRSKSKKSGKNGGQKDDASLPVRIADFFLTVGPGECRQYGKNFQNRSFVKGGSVEIPATPGDITFKPCVLNCCPPESDYSDMELPEFLAPCVFPCDLKLSSVDCPPYTFTFVLTNASGMKLYGAALHVYELVEPEDLARMLGHPVGSNMLPNWPIVYVPKALTVVSHYPFYGAFTAFLRSIYHISLSSAPIPIERYVINFLQEVPLPPSGRTDVRYVMPNHLKMTMSRPPPNKLPMADFSFRPLFTCLSVENIIIVFQCLCAELTVCICSDNLSLLTPVQEAFLSFLFPLVWQGCYIPVMPLNMVEILDAPVPFLIGVHSQYLLTTPKEKRPQSVVFVDLQKDLVDLGSTSELYGTEQTPRVVEPLSKQIRMKLKAKLTEFGGCVYRQRSHLDKLRTAGTAFPSHEQLTPITEFQSNSSMTESDRTSRPPSPPSNNSRDTSPSKRSLSPDPKSDFPDTKSPANMTVLEKLLHSKGGGKFATGKNGIVTATHKDGANGRSNGFGLQQLAHAQPGDIMASSVTTPPSDSILDPVNNTPFGYSCTFKSAWASSSTEEHTVCGTFDAGEIRNAFLRVFVVLLTEYVESYTAAASGSSSNGSKGHGHPTSAEDTNACTALVPFGEGKESTLRGLRNNSSNSLIQVNPKSSSSSIISTVSSGTEVAKKRLNFMKLNIISKPKPLDGSSDKKGVYGKKGAAESMNSPPVPFDHDVFLKAQKDVFLRQLLETQMFCSFEEECGAGPSPLRREKSSEVTFFEESILAKKNRSALSYKSFTPFLSDTSNNVTESFTAPEPTGWGLPVPQQASGTGSGSKEKENTFSYQQFPALSPALYGPIRPARVLLQKPEKGRQLSQSSKALQETIEMRTRTLGRTDSCKSLADSAAKKLALKERMASAKIQNIRSLRSIVAVQSCFRMMGPRRAFLEKLSATRKVQKVYRKYVATCAMQQETSRRNTATFLSMVKRVQAVWRMAARRKEYLRCKHAVIRLQSLCRMKALRNVYVCKKSAITKVQANVRAWIVSKQERYNRAQMACRLRADILLLWEREFTPLGYRSKFYLMIEGDSYLHLALYEEEKKRLVESLGGKYLQSTLISGPLKKPFQSGNRSTPGPSPQTGKTVGWTSKQQPDKGEVSPSRNPLMGSRKASNLGSHVEGSSSNMSLRLDGMERITVIGVPSRLQPNVEARLAISAQMLKDERKEMYMKLKSSASVRDSLFKMFEFEKRMKKKKATLAASVWTNREEAHLLSSAHAVLAVSGCTHTGTMAGTGTSGETPGGPSAVSGGNSEWLNAKLRSRVQSACVESVRACMKSLQLQRERELLEKDSREKAVALVVYTGSAVKSNSKSALKSNNRTPFAKP